MASQPVDQAKVKALGAARSEANRALLVDEAGLDPSRVQVLPSVAARADGDEWVRCRLEVVSGD